MAHQIGNEVTRAYLRTTNLERRRGVMQRWAGYLTGETGDKVVSLKRRIRSSLRA